MPQLTPLLEVRNLSCERQDRLLFNDLCFQLSAGEVIQIAGANGSGKTTLLRMLSGLSLVFEGDILWRGKPVDGNLTGFTAESLYIGHKPGIKTVLTPAENLAAYGANRASLSEDAIDTALAEVGLAGFEDVPCHSLSMGQQRRVALAKLSLFEVPLWILDEPFVSLDVRGVAAFEKRIGDHVSRGGSCILSTHHKLAVNSPFRRIVLGEA